MFKLMYKALIKTVIEHLEQQSNATPHVQKLNEIVMELLDMKIENLNQLLEVLDFNKAYIMFTEIRMKMNEENNSSTLQRFWISFTNMMELLLNTIISKGNSL